MESEELYTLKVDLFNEGGATDISYDEWVEKYLNPFITLFIKEDQQARMGAILNIPLGEI